MAPESNRDRARRRPWLSLAAGAIAATSCAKGSLHDPPSRRGAQGGTTAGSSATTSGTAGLGGSAGDGGGDAGTAGEGGFLPSGGTDGGGGGGAESGSGGDSGAPPLDLCSALDGGAAGSLGAPASGDTLFVEDFERDDDRWQSSAGADFGIVQDASPGSSVYGNGAAVSQPQAAFVRGACFTDVEVQARVKALSFGAAMPGAVAGPCVRVQGDNDYYVVGIQGNGGFGVLRVSRFFRQNLEENAMTSVEEDAWYTVRVEVVGSTIRGYLNGSLMVNVTDATYASGSIGVCAVNVDAVFDDVRVTLP